MVNGKPRCMRTVYWMLMLLLLIGCAGKQTESEMPFADIGAKEDTSRVVVSLMSRVERHEQQAQWEKAAALLERALRIEPRNAFLWHRLAKIRLQQGRYAMAESLAQKSNALAGDNKTLKQRNAELIEAARRSLPAG
jgi:cytochrome c-type biogenesis protein CcmH/NrfG